MTNTPDARDVPTGERSVRADELTDPGARSILEAFHRTDLPKDPDAIFLTVRLRFVPSTAHTYGLDQSWGEWWDPNEQYPLSLDVGMQNEWCPPGEAIEKEEEKWSQGNA